MKSALDRRPSPAATLLPGTNTTPRAECAERVREQAVLLADQLADVSRRLRVAMEEKDRLNRLLDHVLEHLEVGVALTAPDGRVLAANGAARRMGVVAPEDGEPRGFALAECLKDPDTGDGRPFRPRGVSGPMWVARRGSAPLPGGGQGRLVMVEDVSEAVRLEEQAGRRTRLEALGRMAAEIAHEVRNPLGSLELFAALLVDELENQPDARELADHILLGVRQLSGAVTHLLAAVRGRPLRRQAADAAALAREVCASVAAVAAARGVELKGPAGPGIVAAAVDVEAIRQALLNLVSNALDAVSPGGTVTVGAERRAGDLVLEVADSGPGVPPELRERVFEPFFTTRREGTGLGLAVVERVALSHRGAVQLGTSSLGGALFRVVVPDEGAASRTAPEEHPA